MRLERLAATIVLVIALLLGACDREAARGSSRALVEEDQARREEAARIVSALCAAGADGTAATVFRDMLNDDGSVNFNYMPALHGIVDQVERGTLDKSCACAVAQLSAAEDALGDRPDVQNTRARSRTLCAAATARTVVTRH
jgi:hypothetical protein